MWSGQDKVWVHYVKHIIAADINSAALLGIYLRQMSLTKAYIPYLEVIDIQKYKVVKDKLKVRKALRDRADMPFVFVVCKN